MLRKLSEEIDQNQNLFFFRFFYVLYNLNKDKDIPCEMSLLYARFTSKTTS